MTEADPVATIRLEVTELLEGLEPPCSTWTGPDAGAFGAIVGECRREFAYLSASTNLVQIASDRLHLETAASLPVARGEAPEIADFLDRRVLTTYTMSAERDIYHRVLRDLGVAGGPVSARPTTAE